MNKTVTCDNAEAGPSTGPHHMRISSGGSIANYVKFALDFLEVTRLSSYLPEVRMLMVPSDQPITTARPPHTTPDSLFYCHFPIKSGTLYINATTMHNQRPPNDLGRRADQEGVYG